MFEVDASKIAQPRKHKLTDAELNEKAGQVASARRVFGDEIPEGGLAAEVPEKVITMSFCLTEADSWKLKDLAAANKRNKTGEKSVTAIVLKALRDQGIL